MISASRVVPSIQVWMPNQPQATSDRAIASELDNAGFAVLPGLLTPEQCHSLAVLYPRLAGIANGCNARMGREARFPEGDAEFLEYYRDAGQTRPTPLLLQYVVGDYNCRHQDLYCDIWFPIEVAVPLSELGADFTGGEFALTEGRSRMQSLVEIVPLRQGDAVTFALSQRPVRGTRGDYRVTMRLGVSRLRSGLRHAAGIIFHDGR